MAGRGLGGRRGRERDRQREVVAGRAAQRREDRGRVGPVARVGREAGPHERQQRRRHRGQVVLPAADPVHDRHRRTGPERRSAGRGEHHGRGPRVHVGGGGGVLAVEDLRREVAGGAEQPARVREPRVLGQPGQPEVDEHRRAALEQHVGRLDVAVQHADLVHRDDRLGQPGREVPEVGPGDRPLLPDVLVQRQAGHVAGRDVGRLAPGVGVDHLGDPRAGDPAQRRDLAGQPGAGLVVADDVRPQHLEGDARAVRPLREVHHTHAALADLGEQAVVPHAHHPGRGGQRMLVRHHRNTVGPRAREARAGRGSSETALPADPGVGRLRGVLVRPPPVLVVAVPRDGLREPVAEVGVLRGPVGLGPQLRGVDGVAQVVARPVVDVLEPVRGLARQLQQQRDDVPVVALAVGADQVGLPGRPCSMIATTASLWSSTWIQSRTFSRCRRAWASRPAGSR